MKNKWLVILLGLIFIKGIIWLVLTPIFQIPDEASHFSIIEYIGETGHMPILKKASNLIPLDTIKVAEIVNFDWHIIHPVWRGYQSDWQQQISALDPVAKQELIYNRELTALKRPPLYYLIGSAVYLLVKNTSFLTRFFTLRLLSVFFGLAITFFSYQSARIFLRHRLLALAVAALVGFQPMLSHLTAGVHYDPLAILVVSAFIYCGLLRLKTKQKKYFRLCLLLALIGLLVKPDLIVLVFILPFFFNRSQLIKGTIVSALLFFLLVLIADNNTVVFSGNRSHLITRLVYLINLNEYSFHARFFFRSFTSGKIFLQFFNYFRATWESNTAQIFPWYWGVFGWLEKTLPSLVYRVLKVCILISLFGWVKIFVTHSWSKFSHIQKRMTWFLALISLVHFSLVFFNDLIAYSNNQQVFGIQGRYLLTTIVAQFSLLIFGFMQLIPRKYFNVFAQLLIVSAIVLNVIGLITLYNYFGWVWS